MVITSCRSNFSTPKYKKQTIFSKKWKRKHVLIINTGEYKTPTIKKTTRNNMVKPMLYFWLN